MRRDKPLECPIQTGDNAEILLAYCDRRLEPEVAAALERHMEVCAACREQLAAQQAVWAALDAWEAAPISMDFDRRLHRRIDSEGRRSWWRQFFQPVLPFSLRPAMPVAAACVVLVAVVLFRSPDAIEPRTQGRVEAVEIEQVERTLEDLDMLRQLGVEARRETGIPRPM